MSDSRLTGEGSVPAMNDATLLRVPVDAEALARGLVQFVRASVEHGLTEGEAEEAIVVLDRTGVVIAADYDRGVTKTSSGEDRPLSLRFRLPTFTGLDVVGPASRVGVVVRVHDMLEAMRRRVTMTDDSSASVGLLPGDEPSYIDVMTDGDAAAPQRVSHLIVRPPVSSAAKPRKVRVRRPIAPSSVRNLEPQAIQGYLPALSTEALIEAAGVAHPDVGIMLCPSGTEGDHRGFVAGVGTSGIIVETFRASPFAQPNLLSPLDEALSAAGAEVNGAPFPISEPVIISPRMAETVAFVQDAVEEVARDSQRSRARQIDDAIIQVAAAAALDVAGEEVRSHVYASFGMAPPSADDLARMTVDTEAEALTKSGARKLGNKMDTLLGAIPPKDHAAWWTSFEARLLALDAPPIPADAVRELLQGMPNRPIAKRLRVSQNTKDGWMTERIAPLRGTFWKGADGRISAGYNHPKFGTFMITDTAVNADVSRYPATTTELRAAVTERRSPKFAAQLASADLAHAGNAVIGLANLARPRFPDLSTPALLNTVFIARWTPDANEHSPITPHLPVADRAPTDARSVWIGNGKQQERLVVDADGASEAQNGTLSVFGLERGGEVLHMQVPVKAITRKPDQPVGVALDAEHLRSLLGFIVRKGSVSVLEFDDGIIRVATVKRDRVSIIPVAEHGDVPAGMRAIVAAAGVPRSATRSVMPRSAVERVRAIKSVRGDRAAFAPDRITVGDVQSGVEMVAPGDVVSSGSRERSMLVCQMVAASLASRWTVSSLLGRTDEGAVEAVEWLRTEHLDRGVRCVEALAICTSALGALAASMVSPTEKQIRHDYAAQIDTLSNESQKTKFVMALLDSATAQHARKVKNARERQQETEFWNVIAEGVRPYVVDVRMAGATKDAAALDQFRQSAFILGGFMCDAPDIQPVNPKRRPRQTASSTTQNGRKHQTAEDDIFLPGFALEDTSIASHDSDSATGSAPKSRRTPTTPPTPRKI